MFWPRAIGAINYTSLWRCGVVTGHTVSELRSEKRGKYKFRYSKWISLNLATK